MADGHGPAAVLPVPDARPLEIAGAGGLCETEVPPMRGLSTGHQVKCHLLQEMLSRMEPVIRVAAE